MSTAPDPAASDQEGGRLQRSINLDGPPTPLIVLVDGHPNELTPSNLGDETFVNQRRGEWQNNNQSLVFILVGLLTWTDQERQLVLDFIAGFTSRYTVRVNETGPDRDLFAAVIEMLVSNEDVDRCSRGIRAAIQAAVIRHAADLTLACGRIINRLQDLGVRGYRVRDFEEQARALVAAQRAQQRDDGEQVRLVYDVLPNAPVPANLVVPPGWLLNAAGVRRERADEDQPSIWTPVVITRRVTDLSNQTECLGIAWQRDAAWQTRIVERATVATSRTVVELAAYGLPVTSNNAGDLIQFLSDFEAVNADQLPQTQVTSQLGWQGENGADGFLWGRLLLNALGDYAVDNATGIAPLNSGHLAFRGRDQGDEQLADGQHAHGTFEGWCEAIRPLGMYPRARLAIYAALSAVLLAVLRARNFILSYSGPSTVGKTTCARVAASCFGCPDEREAAAAIGCWDATRIWIERASVVLNDIPFIVDDTKRVRHPRLIPQTIYDVAQGRGGGRGSPDGLQETRTFRTVMITTGEAPITSFSEDGGTRARVMELWGSPFGATNEQVGQTIVNINNALTQHYGHAASRFIQFIAEHHNEWTNWREHYRRLQQRFQRRAGADAVAARMAEHFAVLRMTAILAHMAIDLPWRYRDIVSERWGDLVSETPQADRAAAALRHIVSWAHSHRDEFFGQRSNVNSAPTQGWAGRWDRESPQTTATDAFIGFLPHKLVQALREGGFNEPEPIRRTWLDRQWLRTNGNRSQFRARIEGMLTYLVAIRTSAIHELVGEDEPQTPPEPQVPRPVVRTGPGWEQREQSENSVRTP